jgi:hypothetical protein
MKFFSSDDPLTATAPVLVSKAEIFPVNFRGVAFFVFLVLCAPVFLAGAAADSFVAGASAAKPPAETPNMIIGIKSMRRAHFIFIIGDSQYFTRSASRKTLLS